MSDDPRVTVPAELVERLRQAIRMQDDQGGNWNFLGRCARALVDAAERPDEGCEIHKICGCPPVAPVSEPLCRCGHAGKDHVRVMVPATCTQCGCNQFAPPLVPVSDHADCDHTCAVIVSDEDYQRSEGVCAGCGVRMKNDAKTGWGPSLPFGDVPCGSRVGECCPPHKFTNEGAPDVCDTCGDSEHPPVSDEAEAWAEWSADTFEYDGTIAHQAFIAGFRAARQAGKEEQP